MKLRNKKTGEIEEFEYIELYKGYGIKYVGTDSLAELNEEWEDYEEPKGSALNLMILTLINFIENEPDEDKVDLEDCKQMLEKLKAWKRLKDKGFRFIKYDKDHCGMPTIYFRYDNGIDKTDLDLLFSGDEE